MSRRARLHAEGRPRSGSPLRTCVGCRQRASTSDLLRVVADGTSTPPVLVPDPRRRLPGRGAHLHPAPDCLDLAERRRAFPRALRLPGPLDTSALRAYVDEHAAAAERDGQQEPVSGVRKEAEREAHGRSMSAQP